MIWAHVHEWTSFEDRMMDGTRVVWAACDSCFTYRAYVLRGLDQNLYR